MTSSASLRRSNNVETSLFERSPLPAGRAASTGSPACPPRFNSGGANETGERRGRKQEWRGKEVRTKKRLGRGKDGKEGRREDHPKVIIFQRNLSSFPSFTGEVAELYIYISLSLLSLITPECARVRTRA